MRRRLGRTRTIDPGLALAIILGTLAANLVVWSLFESFDREYELRNATSVEVDR